MGGRHRPEPRPATTSTAPHYRRFGSELAARIRREVYGEDLGQTGWRIGRGAAAIAEMLALGPGRRPARHRLRLGRPVPGSGASARGARVVGLDIEPPGVAHARAAAGQRGLRRPCRPSRSPTAAGGCRSRTPASTAVLCVDAVIQPPGPGGHARASGRASCGPAGGCCSPTPWSLTGEITKPELDHAGLAGLPPVRAARLQRGRDRRRRARRCCASTTRRPIGRDRRPAARGAGATRCGTRARRGCRVVRAGGSASWRPPPSWPASRRCPGSSTWPRSRRRSRVESSFKPARCHARAAAARIAPATRTRRPR